ncbi:hypothetical protein MKJ04_00745 [Pontibacter sp. E15-1]|uniref:hypothetical protein n=1 Tax=Pontibacter sp. E15-1 TaxID=2919918 RepID=UPI001F4F7803|nr:hypothetical protein [Pontibacter sp. E15-1]MCJ8163350.1 hypothetical protein [Pontibacter sp. E15-1]
MRRLFLLSVHLLTALLLFTSCNKDDDGCYVPETIEATLHWTGDYALDGCGYILTIGDTDYKPKNEEDIPDTYKQPPITDVNVQILHYSENVRVCQAGVEMKSVKVLELSKR